MSHVLLYMKHFHCQYMTSFSHSEVDNDWPKQLLKFCRDIASGMNYLSSKAFVHRDLAARNILVAEDCTCKVSSYWVCIPPQLQTCVATTAASSKLCNDHLGMLALHPQLFM